MELGDAVKLSVETVNKLSVLEMSDDDLPKLTAAFRCLRNECAKGCHVQKRILDDDRILHSTYVVLNYISNHKSLSEEMSLCLLVGLQFIANLLVNNRHVQNRIWETYQNVLNSSIWLDHIKIQNCTAMIIYNIFLSHPDTNLEKNLFERLITLTTDSKTSEFPLYLLQLLASKTTYLVNVYDTLTKDSKLIMIDVMQDYIQNESGTLCNELINFFIQKFEKHSDNILSMLDSVDVEAFEVVKILELVVSLSSSGEAQLKYLQTQNSLLINCTMLLKSVHALSKEPDNNFTMIQKLSELDEIEKNTKVQEHPYFGFKCSLIRLIGNLCWKNVNNQNHIRDLDVIPVLLDCCNIDGRNPFIIQWTIFAVRNICDNNAENQKYIASMQRIGTIDVEKLEKIGIVLNKESDGSTLSICPLEIKK